ncbi:MAG: FKBP-type peptidyl-prolyl cis-trans isomerase [Bacteroidales bacterium]|nr:FKBP-type peptidyl-prolyl cis-trans isomerase [Bacteroidales bacterium]
MRKIMLSILAIVLITNMTFAQKKETKKMSMKNELDSISYFLGNEIGNYYRTNDIHLNSDLFMEGMVDALNNSSKLDEETKEKVMAMFQQQQQKKANQQLNMTKEAGRKFLEENKKNPDVKTTASGLQYKIVKTTTEGVSPKASDQVNVHYHGTLIDGTVFDSSVQRGETITFGLNQVIRGWTEGLQLMKTGEKFIFYIPSELGYGDRAAGPQIPGGSTLIFEVELFKVNP